MPGRKRAILRAFLRALFQTISGVIGLMLPTAGARAADVTGQVNLTGKGILRDAVVTLEGNVRATPATKVVIDQRDKTFLPHVTVIPRGTTVEFPNHDTVFHNVYAYYNAKKFDLGMYPRGATKTVTFDKVGVVAILCNVHADMSAYILVVDTPYYAVTDGKGRFLLHNVAAGTYTLHIWHESGATSTQSITLTNANTTLNLNAARK